VDIFSKVAVAVALVRSPTWLRVVAAIVALGCLVRLVLEVVGQPRGALDSLAPIGFLVLVAVLTFFSFRGRRPVSGPGPSPHLTLDPHLTVSTGTGSGHCRIIRHLAHRRRPEWTKLDPKARRYRLPVRVTITPVADSRCLRPRSRTSE
jgi:hypothetical protein